MGNVGTAKGRYEGACARDVARSGNVTVYKEIRVYAETQVHTSRMGRSGGDGEGGKRMYKSWSKLFFYAYAINLCVPPRSVIVNRVYLFASSFVHFIYENDKVEIKVF